jgi:glycosyltransferase involved in cell wall biosynthesis
MSSYDLVHVFQLDWVAETYFHVINAKKQGKPVILSPIHHSVKDVEKFETKYVFDLRRVSRYLTRDQFKRDTFKNIYRAVFDYKRTPTVFYSVVKGLKNMHIQMLKLSDAVLVQTEAEARDLMGTYGVNINWHKVQNGVSENFLQKREYVNHLGIKDYIICVGRIEARKNQLSVIKAVENLRKETNKDIKLVLIGYKSSQKHFEYVYRFNKELQKHDWIKYIGAVPYTEIADYYHYAKVCISASWFETSGLTLIEALFCGANVVATGERAKEFLGEFASYCEPDNIVSITSALKKEYEAKVPVMPEDMRSQYTWHKTALETKKVYEMVLKK